MPDNDGRTPLHWAAYKGFADSIRLLLVLDARFTLPDKEGCTPLHWGAIKGNGEACTVLLQVCPAMHAVPCIARHQHVCLVVRFTIGRE